MGSCWVSDMSQPPLNPFTVLSHSRRRGGWRSVVSCAWSTPHHGCASPCPRPAGPRRAAAARSAREGRPPRRLWALRHAWLRAAARHSVVSAPAAVAWPHFEPSCSRDRVGRCSTRSPILSSKSSATPSVLSRGRVTARNVSTLGSRGWLVTPRRVICNGFLPKRPRNSSGSR